MKIAPIFPTDYIAYLAGVTRFHMLLPMQVNDDSRSAIESLCPIDHYTILDNGVYEGTQVSFQDLLGYADEFNINEIVLPDVFKDAAANLALHKETFANKIPDASGKGIPLGYMIVPQGKDAIEWLINLERIRNALREAHPLWAVGRRWVIGMPKWLGAEDYTVRPALLEYFYQQGESWPIHLLGCNDLNELRAIRSLINARKAKVRSMDTSFPIKLAYEGHNIHSGKRPGWDSVEFLNSTMPLAPEDQKLITYNLSHFLEIAEFEQYNDAQDPERW